MLNGTKCVCVSLIFLFSMTGTSWRATAIPLWTYYQKKKRKKNTFFSCPILFLNTFFSIFLLFGAQFAHVKLVWVGFFFFWPLSIQCSLLFLFTVPTLVYITLIFWYLLISEVPLKFIYYKCAQTAKSSSKRSCQWLQNIRNHIEICTRTAAIKQKQKKGSRNKKVTSTQYLQTAWPKYEEKKKIRMEYVCVIVNNMLVTLTLWMTEVMGEHLLFRLSGSSIKLQHHIAQSSVGGAEFLSCSPTLSSPMLDIGSTTSLL